MFSPSSLCSSATPSGMFIAGAVTGTGASSVRCLSVHSACGRVDPRRDSSFSIPSCVSIPRRRTARSVSSSPPQAESSSGGGHEIARVPRDSPAEIAFKDSPALPRPLSVSGINASSAGSRLRVAYQGLPGAYSEEAALKAYPNCEAVPCESFESAFDAVEHWLVDRAVLPIENSLGGGIYRNYDLLLNHRLHIVGEVNYPVRYCLLANHGVQKENLRRVLSHPQALAQCENTLTKLKVIREAVDDTAGAAKYVADQMLQDTGAVASALAAEIYGLNILARDILDDSENVTRFVILAREPIIPNTDRPFKTSIVFSLEEGPGMLFKALAVFAMREMNLTQVLSRPQRKKPLRVAQDGNNGPIKYFDYLFYLDFEASLAAPYAQNALRHMEEFTTFLRVLGSYPMDMKRAA